MYYRRFHDIANLPGRFWFNLVMPLPVVHISDLKPKQRWRRPLSQKWISILPAKLAIVHICSVLVNGSKTKLGLNTQRQRSILRGRAKTKMPLRPTLKFFSLGLTELVVITIVYLFLSSWAGGIEQILQSDWFLERVEFSHPDRHSGRSPSSRSKVNYFCERIVANRRSFAVFTLP